LHLQAEARLRALIAQEPFASGKEKLTDEVTLAKKWGISRNTLRQAITRLVGEGRLRRVAGQGTRVLPAPVRSEAGAWTSFTREMRDRGIVVKNIDTRLEKLPAPADVAKDLNLAPGSEAWRLRRVREWGEGPAIIAESWLPPHPGLPTAEEFHRYPFYEVIQQVTHAVPARSIEEIRAVAAPKDVAESLGLEPGAPVLFRRRVIRDTEGVPLEVNLNWYRGDRYAMTLELKAN
jgi:GntR family transcriptional regulator